MLIFRATFSPDEQVCQCPRLQPMGRVVAGRNDHGHCTQESIPQSHSWGRRGKILHFLCQFRVPLLVSVHSVPR